MLTLPAKRTRISPRLDYQVMSLVETLPVVNRVGVGGHALLPDTADKAADHPATGDVSRLVSRQLDPIDADPGNPHVRA